MGKSHTFATSDSESEHAFHGPTSLYAEAVVDRITLPQLLAITTLIEADPTWSAYPVRLKTGEARLALGHRHIEETVGEDGTPRRAIHFMPLLLVLTHDEVHEVIEQHALHAAFEAANGDSAGGGGSDGGGAVGHA